MKTFFKVLIGLAIIASVILLTLYITALILPQFESIGDVVNYIFGQFTQGKAT